MSLKIALIAHDRKKETLVNLVRQYQPVLQRYQLIATGTTGQQIQQNTNLKINCLLSGSLGGDAQIAAQVAEGKVTAVIFLIDPLHAQPHEPDIRALLRICEVHNTPLATNLATAEIILQNLAKTRIAHLIFNPVSGKGNPDQDLDLIKQILSPHFNLKIHLTTPEISAEQLAKKALETGADLVIASGGDGTVSAVAGVLFNSNIPLGIIPRGTANAFVAALGMPASITPIRTACQIILEDNPITVDGAICNQKPMILLTGIGYEAETVERADRELKNQWGKLAYLIAGWQQLNQQKSFTTKLTIDGENYQFEAVAVTVANAAPPTSIFAQGMGEVIYNDGLLDVTIATFNESQSNYPKLEAIVAMAKVLGAALVKSEPNHPNIYHFRTKKIKIETEVPQKVVIDGEIEGITPLEIESYPQSLPVFFPKPNQGNS
jgi:diacylglycerol kinase (ATP)